MCVYVYVCMYFRLCAFVCVSLCVSLCVCLLVCLCICLYVCMCGGQKETAHTQIDGVRKSLFWKVIAERDVHA